MTDTKTIRRIAIIGTGVIGASWTALFLAKGLHVVATDIAPDAEIALRKFVKAAWPALERLGLSPGASQSNLTFTADLAEALAGADLVQENGPERIDFKQKLYGQLDELLPPDVIIASSSSGLKMSEIQSGAASHPERCVIGHPFNPPHLIPLVEIVGGAKTSEETIQRAIEFYTSIGKKAVRLNKEMPGHVANRLQARVGARGLLPRRRGCAERCRRRRRAVLGTGPALGHHGQHDAQSPRRRPRRHRALLPAVRRPDDGFVEDPRLAGADARRSKRSSSTASTPRSDRAPSRSSRPSATRSCSACSSCAPSVRRSSRATRSQPSSGWWTNKHNGPKASVR